MKTAILFGASGFVGSYLLKDLLKDDDYSKVIVVVRKALDIRDPKLEIVIGDYNSLPGLKAKLVADEVFIAIGTTKAKTPDKNEYYQIDHDYPVLAAKMVKENGFEEILLTAAAESTTSYKARQADFLLKACIILSCKSFGVMGLKMMPLTPA